MAKTKLNTNQINLGDESAIDLLIERNTAKSDLATNLQGKGINADASTQTLNQLVNEVPNIQSDSEREVIECLTLNDQYSINNMSSYSRDVYFNLLHGYLFYINGREGSTLKWIKLSDITDNISSFINTYYSASTLGIVSTLNLGQEASVYESTAHRLLSISKNKAKLFICYKTSSNNLSIYDVSWQDDRISSITLNKTVTVVDETGTARHVLNVDANSNGSKLLVSLSDKNALYVYDVQNESISKITGTSPSNQNYYPYFVGLWLTDSTFISVCHSYETNKASWRIDQYTLNDTVATSVLDSYIDTSTITIMNYSEYYWGQGLTLYEYDTNKFKLLINNGGNLSSKDTLMLSIYDTYTHTLKEYNKNIWTAFLTPTSGITLPVTIRHDTENHRFIVSIGRCVFLIFDENWNFINGFNQMMQRNTNRQMNGVFLLPDINMIIGKQSSDGDNLTAIPYYWNKKTIVKKTVSINEEQKDYFYIPYNEITIADIEAGYFDGSTSEESGESI